MPPFQTHKNLAGWEPGGWNQSTCTIRVPATPALLPYRAPYHGGLRVPPSSEYNGPLPSAQAGCSGIFCLETVTQVRIPAAYTRTVPCEKKSAIFRTYGVKSEWTLNAAEGQGSGAITARRLNCVPQLFGA